MNTGKVFWGLLIVVVGVVLFLGNLGVIDRGFWHYIFRFWPVLLIIWGISILLGDSRSTIWVILFLMVVTFGAAIFFWNSSGYKNIKHQFTTGNENMQIPAEIEVASLKLDYGAGKLNIDGNSERTLVFAYHDPIADPKIDYNTKGNKIEYKIKQASANFINSLSTDLPREWNFSLPQGVIWHLDLDFGATKGDLDFREVDLKSLDLDMGAGDVSIWLGDRGLETNIEIDAGASKVKVIVPDTMELKIKTDGGLNATNLDELGLIKIGNYYVTEGITSSSKLILEFDGGVSKFELVRRSQGASI